MSAPTPTARELLGTVAQMHHRDRSDDCWCCDCRWPCCVGDLAARVEAVLVYCAEERGGEERKSLARQVVRLLNGEQP